MAGRRAAETNPSEILRALAETAETIDTWDHDFQSPPTEAYEALSRTLQGLGERAFAATLAALADPAPGLRREAARAAAQLRPPGAAPLLSKALAADPDGQVRTEAATALGRLREGEEALRAALASPDPAVRDAAARALGASGAAAALRHVLDGGVHLRPSALGELCRDAVGEIGAAALPLAVAAGLPASTEAGAQAWELLLEAAPAQAREAFVALLRRSDGVEAVTACGLLRRCGGSWALPVLVELLSRPDVRLRRVAAEALAKVGDARGIEPLVALLATEDRPWARLAAVPALFAVAARERIAVAGQAAATAARCSDDGVLLARGLAAAAARSEEAAARPQVREALASLLAGGAEATAAAAVEAAIAWKLWDLAPEVTGTLAHPRWFASYLCRARESFFRAAGAPAVAVLARAAADGGPTAARALEELGRHPAHAVEHLDVLLRAVSDGSDEACGSAAWALGQVCEPRAAEALLASAAARPPQAAYRAFQALARLRERRVVPLALGRLAPLLEGGAIGRAEEWWLAASCLEALGAVGTAQALAALRRGLGHADMRLRRDAASALGDSGSREAVTWLEAMRDDPEPQVRRAAEAALRKLLASTPPPG